MACRDKGKIKPHGVRCVGNVVAWALRLNSDSAHDNTQDTPCTHDTATSLTHTHDRVPATLPHTCTAVSLSEALVREAVEGLVECATTGSNMKTRWNACHALGSILAAAEPSLDQQTWKVMYIFFPNTSNFYYKWLSHALIHEQYVQLIFIYSFLITT